MNRLHVLIMLQFPENDEVDNFCSKAHIEIGLYFSKKFNDLYSQSKLMNILIRILKNRSHLPMNSLKQFKEPKYSVQIRQIKARRETYFATTEGLRICCAYFEKKGWNVDP